MEVVLLWGCIWIYTPDNRAKATSSRDQSSKILRPLKAELPTDGLFKNDCPAPGHSGNSLQNHLTISDHITPTRQKCLHVREYNSLFFGLFFSVFAVCLNQIVVSSLARALKVCAHAVVPSLSISNVVVVSLLLCHH